MRPPRAPRRPEAGDGPGRDRGQDLIIADDDTGFEDTADDDGGYDDGGGDLALGDGSSSGPTARLTIAPIRSLEPAFAARDAARRRVLCVRLGVGAGIAALLALLAWLALLSPVLALDAEQVAVEGGGTYVDPVAVAAVAASQEGTSLLRVDTSAVREGIEAMPAVASATIARDFPRGLTITVEPREPVALVAVDDASVQLVASNGAVIATVPPDQAPPGLPQLAVDTSMPEAGAAVNDVLTVLAAMPADLLAQVAQAGASAPGAVRLEMLDGASVIWGSAEENELKASVLATLLQVGASTYDVSEPRTPLTT